jgi:hypothetical protein
MRKNRGPRAAVVYILVQNYMKSPVLLCVVCLCGVLVLMAGANPDLQQLLSTAKQQANLLDNDAGPFQLDVDFHVPIGIPIQGH